MKLLRFILAALIFIGLCAVKTPRNINNQVAAKSDKQAQATPQVQEVIPPPKPARWSVSTSPKTNLSVEKINTALAVYQDMGMTKQGAAYLVGNFMGESGLEPCASIKGDGGLAWGLGQWHPGRRVDMPCDYVEQLNWAVNVEMTRDRPQLKETLFNTSATIADIQLEIYRWERWGHLGDRWHYAAGVHEQLN